MPMLTRIARYEVLIAGQWIRVAKAKTNRAGGLNYILPSGQSGYAPDSCWRIVSETKRTDTSLRLKAKAGR
jgi:hypothetical protein